MRCLVALVLTMTVATARGGPVGSFDDIQFWTGEGENRAAMAVDWVEGSADDTSLVWGYRWDGEAQGIDMFQAILQADPRFFAKVQDYGGSLGYAIYGIGYDDGDLDFALDDGTVFDTDGLADVAASSDGAAPLDTGDVYAEGWFLGFWHYGVAESNPYAGASWSSSGLGASSRELTDGAWDSWAFTPSFNFNAFAENPYAAVPEPSSVALLATGALLMSLRGARRSMTALLAALFIACGASAAVAGPFAWEVVSYTPGDPVGVGNPAPYQTDGTQALGSPSCDTLLGSQVGVFYPAFGGSELVIVGGGGELTVRFEQPVENDPANPFGMDLLVFGNAFYVVNQDGLATGAFTEPGTVSDSQDGATWFEIPNAFADDLFPALGYLDTAYGGFGNSGGTIPTDFTLPVNPSFEGLGKSEAEINAGYAGAGGGTGIDLDSVSLDWIEYVRVSQPIGATWSTEIDAFADVSPVPEPSTLLIASVGLLSGALVRTRRAGRVGRFIL